MCIRDSEEAGRFRQAKGMVNYQYLVGDTRTNEALLVDGAWDPAGIVRFAKSRGVELRGYVATHFHYDHIGGVEQDIPGLAWFVDSMNLTAYVPDVEQLMTIVIVLITELHRKMRGQENQK
eukprot:TRINITY_DN3439_c0_g1_i1.p1 TRINITY_DN3439_c0_g1~~TRINITY_DN3439_c0_g1_i1.p1  ORF type:complete len:121 (-),score=29.48 TRINITY_DN3439_c0_g1_i1:26-388(-)